MTSAEKILAGIISDAEETAQQKKAEANEKAKAIIAQAEQEAKALSEDADKDIERQTALIKKTGLSSADLILRDAALSAKRELIEQTLSEAKGKVLSMPDNEYFAFLCEIAENSACEGGEIFLSEKDLSRDTTVLKNFLSKKNIVLSTNSADINGGFILKNGDIEINASLDALIHEKHADLVDAVNKILFNRKGED